MDDALPVKSTAGTDPMRNAAIGWDESHRYTPTSRHRRRWLLHLVAPLEFADCLDAGCCRTLPVAGDCGTARRAWVRLRHLRPSDRPQRGARTPLRVCGRGLVRETWPGGRRFDLVICTETLEHIPDWVAAVRHLARMSRRYLLLTVPGGKLRQTERRLGHHRHYAGPELVAALNAAGCQVLLLRHWGFPMQTLYKALINAVAHRRAVRRILHGPTKI